MVNKHNLIKITSDDIDFKATPAKIEFTSYQMLKDQVDKLVNQLDGYVVTADSYKTDKKTRANLNKLSKSLAKKRIYVKKQLSVEVDRFNAQVKGLSDELDQVTAKLNKEIKFYDNKAKNSRHEINISAISKYLKPLNIPLEAIKYDPKWDNTNNNFKAMIQNIKEQGSTYLDSAKVIRQKADQNNQSSNNYLNMLFSNSLSEILEKMDKDKQAIQDQIERDRAKKLAEIATKKAQEQVAGNKIIDKSTGEIIAITHNYIFRLVLTDEQLHNLANYFRDNGITPLNIKREKDE